MLAELLQTEPSVKRGRKALPGLLKTFRKQQGPSVAKDILHLVPKDVGGEDGGFWSWKDPEVLG